MREGASSRFAEAFGASSAACPVIWATSLRARLRGLLAREGFEGLCVIAPCDDIHTLFMRTPIDAAFVGLDGRVLSAWRGMPPFRRMRSAGAAFVVERFAREDPWFQVGDVVCPCVDGKGATGDLFSGGKGGLS